MTKKRFTMKGSTILENNEEITAWDCCDLLNELHEENEQLKEENKRLHTKIFEMRTNIALERTEISRETYTAKKNAKEFLDDLEKWWLKMTKERFEVMDYFDSENKPIKAIRDNETTEIYSMDNELEANSTCEKMNILYEENQQLKEKIKYLQKLRMEIRDVTIKEAIDKIKEMWE